MTGSPSLGRPRLRVLLALAFVMTVQALALNHLIGHSARGDNAGCAICVSASHAGNAVPASAIEIHILQLADRPAIPAVAGQLRPAPPAVYRSRAPPAFT
jgi:hypothetical protein